MSPNEDRKGGSKQEGIGENEQEDVEVNHVGSHPKGKEDECEIKDWLKGFGPVMAWTRTDLGTTTKKTPRDITLVVK